MELKPGPVRDAGEYLGTLISRRSITLHPHRRRQVRGAMLSDFFIRRPIFASVLSILITLVGAISIPSLPVEQYPNLAAPQVTVTSTYIGASAEVVESAVTTVLERQLNGLEGMRYISSTSSNNGTSTITVTFEPERELDVAAVDVQNRVATASARLPAEVNALGITINKTQSQLLMSFGLYDQEGRYDTGFLSNYADVYVRDALLRVKGVGDVRIFGERRFAMRLWLDPTKLASRGLTAQDVVGALREQNVQVAAEQVGQPPAPQGQTYQITVQVLGQLSTPEQFGDIVVQRGEDGTLVRMKDVGRAELGAENYGQLLRFNGRDAVGLGIFQLPGSNALEVREGVIAELERLEGNFPPGLVYERAFDTTAAVEESINEVLFTLVEAVARQGLPAGFTFEWTGLSLEQKQASGKVLLIFGLGLLFVFLVLAAQYESFALPFVIMLAVPVALLGALGLQNLRGLANDVFCQVGLVMLVGLSSKNAVLIVEFAEQLRHQGKSVVEAAIEAADTRLRPILMTSFAFLLGVVPLVLASGAGAASRKSLGTAVFGGMLLSTFVNLIFIPVLYTLVETARTRLLKRHEHGPRPA